VRGKPEGKDPTKLTELDLAGHHEMLSLEKKREQARGKVLSDICLVIVLVYYMIFNIYLI
jgi:hypothetical protein